MDGTSIQSDGEPLSGRVLAGTPQGGYGPYCTGPAADGSCPQVAIGRPIACAGLTIKPGWAPESEPYRVQTVMTICPVTLARSLAVDSDSAFTG